jgi:putative FmdB family regulatory protein
MPLYEYRCNHCQAVTSALSFTWSDATSPVCRQCGGFNLTKLISRFAFHRSWGDSLNWVPSGETLTDVNEDDPQSLDRFMGRVQDEMGGQVTPDFNQMRKELTADP